MPPWPLPRDRWQEINVSLRANRWGDVPNIFNILVVSKFADIFLKDFLGLPLFRKMEFGIDLAACVRPIFRAPYRMALTELKELKTQLKIDRSTR